MGGFKQNKEVKDREIMESRGEDKETTMGISLEHGKLIDISLGDFSVYCTGSKVRQFFDTKNAELLQMK